MTHPDHLADEVFSDLVDGQLSAEDASRAHAHLATCLACQTRLEEMRTLVGVLRALPSVEPPRDFRLGPRLVADPPNVIRLRRWYAWSRAGAGALAAAFVFLSAGTLYVDSRPASSPATLASKAQPAAPEVATAPQNPAAPAARNAAAGAASDAAGAPAAQPPAAPAPASAARPAAVPAASPAAQAPGAAAAAPAAGAAVRAQGAPAPTSTETGDQIAAATTVRPLPTPIPTPTQIPQVQTPLASAAPSAQQADPAAPLRVAAALVGVLAACGILLALFVRHRLQTASSSQLE